MLKKLKKLIGKDFFKRVSLSLFDLGYKEMRLINILHRDYSQLSKQERLSFKHPPFHGDFTLKLCWGILVTSIDNPRIFLLSFPCLFLLLLSIIDRLI